MGVSMQALRYHEFGGPEVLRVEEAPEPVAGPGQVLVAVRAASVNPVDCKTRAGYLAEMIPTTFPAIPGMDAAGVVESVGEGVESVAAGDRVFGLGSATTAELAVLDMYAPVPPSMSFTQAAALGLAVETAARTLDRLTLPEGGTLLVDGAAGGVGSAMVQLARARGLRVIGTAGAANQDYLTSLGATPTSYGEGLAERVAALAPEGIDAAVDVVGLGSVPALIAIIGDPTRVATVADFTAYALGVHVADVSTGRAGYALQEAASLFEDGRFLVAVEEEFAVKDAAQAHRRSEQGHVRGKLVITVS
jgi:NADPH:quinone reductase-like Zn-dependent oxidoreductase